MPGPRFVSFTISCLISQQASIPVSCAVNFLKVCPFLHLYRLPFSQILKTMCFWVDFAVLKYILSLDSDEGIKF